MSETTELADAKVFRVDGNERYLAGWYWVRLDDAGDWDGEPEGPFDGPIQAGSAAREWLVDRADPTPWCAGCGAMTKAGCNCGPIADNE